MPRVHLPEKTKPMARPRTERTVGQTWCLNRQEWVTDLEGEQTDHETVRLVRQVWSDVAGSFVTVQVIDMVGPNPSLEEHSEYVRDWRASLPGSPQQRS